MTNNVDVAEYRTIALIGPTGVPMAQGNSVVVAYNLTVTSVTQTSTTFSPATRMIRVHTDTAVAFRIGTNATATATDSRMSANQTEYFGVVPGDRISIIA